MDKKSIDLFYGEAFPNSFSKEDGSKWKEWIRKRVEDQKSEKQSRDLLTARNRHFRAGRMWISSRNRKTWREPQKDENTIRATLPIIGPALDYRLGVMEEQNPGFKTQPLGSSTRAKEVAQAQQSVVEYHYHSQKAQEFLHDAESAAQTDGVSFLHVYIDKNAGPEKDRVELVNEEDERFKELEALGYHVRDSGLLELPLDESGQPAGPEAEASKKNLGEIATRVLYSSEVIVDPEAKTVNGPYDKAKWLIVRKPRDIKDARIETGKKDLEPDSEASDLVQIPQIVNWTWSRGLPPWPESRLKDKEIVYENLVYLAKSKHFPEGAWIKVIGDVVIDGKKKLPGGVIPLAPIKDGSSDPALFPQPEMNNWLGDQISVNMLLSQLLQHARIWGPGRFLAHKDTNFSETWTSIMGSIVEYSGMKPDVVSPPRTTGDVWNLLTFLIRKLEDKTGWNDLARGRVSDSGSFQDVSGRAILGARELFERAFGPMIRAAAQGVSKWAELVIIYAQWLYDEPRMIPMVGGRTDLAKRIGKEQLGSTQMVYVDPNTMMPLPRALRNQMLFDLYEKGMISLAEYKSRAPFAIIQDVYSGEQQQWNRAQQINEILSETWMELNMLVENDQLLGPYSPETGVPILWADEPSVHKDALNEIVLDDTKPWKLRRLALERFVIYSELEQAKNTATGVDMETGQPVQPSPVPLEVIGAPSNLPQAQGQASQRGGAEEASQGPAPGTPPTASVAPEMSGTTPPIASQQQALPLGELGDVEKQAASGEELPQ